MTPLRQRLRAETRPEHEALDVAFGALDLGDVHDYGLFIRAHHAAHTLIEPRIAPAPPRLAALARDLDALGLAPLQNFDVPAIQTADPRGLAYVVAGSHLGGKILHRRWESSENAKIRAAGHYFAVPNVKEHWQITLKVLKGTTPDNHNSVVEGARSAFSCFAMALRQVKGQD